MASTTPKKTPRRTFGTVASDSAIADDTDSPATTPAPRRSSVFGRLSFSKSVHRSSFSAKWRAQPDEEGGAEPQEQPPIPSALQPVDETTTPLHALSMTVLCITMLGEFLSANVSTPFVLHMVEGFEEERLKDKADVAFWTGILVSAFFMTQFLTSLLWATVAEKHGRRTVLVVSLFGSALTCGIFGTCTTLKEALCIRLLQGVFAGAVGVARGSVAFVTDVSNEGRAYAILGFCWGLGGVTGAIIGGSFERPAVKWPGIFADIPVFVNYPYLLPCAIAASVTFTGSVLACFLSRDGGPREGAIQLLPEKNDAHPEHGQDAATEEGSPPSPIFEEELPQGVVGSLRRKVSKRFSGYLGRSEADASPRSLPTGSSPLNRENSVPMSSPERSRTFSRTSRANGSAYGYTGAFRNRLASDATTTGGARRGSMVSSIRRRRGTNTREGHHESISGTDSDLNFAQRLLMANAPAVTNIADLWVAAAMNVDNEDPFESDTEMGSDGDDRSINEDLEADVEGSENRPSGYTLGAPRRGSNASALRPPTAYSSRRPSGSQQNTPVRQSISGFLESNTPTARRFSSSVPAIFQHAGVKTPSAVIDAQQLLLRAEQDTPVLDSLPPIVESRRTSLIEPDAVTEKPPSLSSQLPWMIIIQYGLIALHTTTHDQVFMSYLVSDFEDGGLNLNAGHFAQLIALMCLAQIAYQFYLYPNIGPPRGRFSHLSMFRLGSLLFIPSYLLVTLFRPFASAEEDGNFPLMVLLSLATALRFCGITFGYTSISILLNYMTPPDAVGYANGLAQSIVSLARFIGPILGGLLWSISTHENPSGYPLGFIFCALVCFLAVAHSFLIR